MAFLTFIMLFGVIIFTIGIIASIFFGITSAVLIAKWKKQKKRGENPQKWWLILSTIALIISIHVVLVPVCIVIFMLLMPTLDSLLF